MRAVVQRVSRAEVRADGEVVGRINHGLLVYAGVADDDGPEDIEYAAAKIRHLRVFPDPAEKLNLDVVQVGGAVLIVSNFTLLADARKGRRPDFARAAQPAKAEECYELLCNRLHILGVPVQKGRFRAMMAVEAVNDGPINILLDSKRGF